MVAIAATSDISRTYSNLILPVGPKSACFTRFCSFYLLFSHFRRLPPGNGSGLFRFLRPPAPGAHKSHFLEIASSGPWLTSKVHPSTGSTFRGVLTVLPASLPTVGVLPSSAQRFAILPSKTRKRVEMCGKADSGREGSGETSPEARRSPPPTGGRGICSKMCLPSAREMGPKSGLGTRGGIPSADGIQVLFDGAACLHP